MACYQVIRPKFREVNLPTWVTQQQCGWCKNRRYQAQPGHPVGLRGYLTSRPLLGSPLDLRKCSRPEQKEKERKGEGGREGVGKEGKERSQRQIQETKAKRKGYLGEHRTWQDGIEGPQWGASLLCQLFLPHLWVRASFQEVSVLSEGGYPIHSLLHPLGRGLQMPLRAAGSPETRVSREPHPSLSSHCSAEGHMVGIQTESLKSCAESSPLHKTNKQTNNTLLLSPNLKR